MSDRRLLAGLGLLTLLRLALGANIPLSPDEAYYWTWSKSLAGGYLDHPPMVAWMIRAGTAIAGDSPLGIRLFAPIAAAVGSLALARAADRLFPEKASAGAWAAGFLNATLLFGAGAVTMTPDTPLLLFWTLAFAAAAEMACGRGGAIWALGLAAGCAMLSKYTALLLAPAVALWLAASRDMRRWFLDRRLYAAAALALLLFSPVLVWNEAHGWASFAKQGGRVGDFDLRRAAQFLGELLVGQIGLATPLIALLCAAGAASLVRRRRETAAMLCLAMTFAPLAVFSEHALGDRVQANWPAIIYPSAAVAAALFDASWARRLRVPAIASGFALTAFVFIQALAAPLPLPRAIDPTLSRLGGWPEFVQAVAARAKAERAAFVAADNYGEASILAFLMPSPIPVLGVEDRWRQFDFPNGQPIVAGRTGLLVRSARRAGPPPPADWTEIAAEPDLIRERRGIAAEAYHVYRVTGANAAAIPIAIMPRPPAHGDAP